MAWLQFNDIRDVAAIFFSPDSGSARWVREKIIEAITEDNDLTDMKVLSRISQDFLEQVSFCPIAPCPDSKLFSSGIPEESRIRNSIGTEYFGGIFDSAPIGMWTLGQDPRNHHGFIKRGISLVDSYVQPQMLTTNPNDGDQLIVEGQLPIFNLHVHCKEPKYFKSANSKSAIDTARSSIRGELNSKFSITSFFALTQDFLQRHGARTPIVLFTKLMGNSR